MPIISRFQKALNAQSDDGADVQSRCGRPSLRWHKKPLRVILTNEVIRL